MINTLKHHYHKLSGSKRLLFVSLFFLGVFAATFRFIHADKIPFESSLSNIFHWLNTGHYSNTHFTYGGNNFVGIIFQQTGATVAPELITIDGGAQAMTCTGKLRGVYYNNQRGRRIWPLDTENLTRLQTISPATGYASMTLSGGFYTNCTHQSGSFYPNPNEVYGQIDHTINGQTGFRMIAGINYNFTGNTFSGLYFGHTFTIATGDIQQGYMFDTYGGIAQLSMNMPRCGSFSVNPPTPEPEGYLRTFMCEGNSTSGYILRIYSGSNQVYIQTQSSTGVMLHTTGEHLSGGTYIATCTILGGLGAQVSCPNVSFQVETGSTPSTSGSCDPNFQGEITFSPATSGGIVMTHSAGTYYSNKTGIIIQRAATHPTLFTLSGDFVPGTFSESYTGNSIFNYAYVPFTLTKTNDWNYLSSTFTTGTCSYTDALKRVFVDTLPPTAPIITSPSSGANVCPTTPFTLSWLPATDGTGSQISHYTYEIYNNSGIVFSGTNIPYNVFSTTIPQVALLPLGTYSINVKAVDYVGLTTSSTTGTFNLSPQYCPASTGVVIVTPTIRLRNVDLDKVYSSDPIRVLGLTGPTLMTISKGMLYINNHTGGNGTTGMVTSHDTIYIELVSSDEYDTTVTSQMSVAGLTGTFSLTTKKSNCILSVAEQLTVQNIYENLKDEYDNDISKFSEFLNTFQSMVEDEEGISDSCTLEYLLQLIEEDFDVDGIDTSKHITPNCKEYNIGYDATQRAYYSPDMMNRHYFINRESLIRHLDYYNPGDCHLNTYGDNYRTTDDSDPMKHIAPNGKIYHLVGQYGGYSAEEFLSPKYFDSLQSIKTYIDLRNPPKTIWRHTIDTAFIPTVYAAPNSKEYKIYKTNLGFMSYKLMKVQYFSTLSEIKSYIDRNNPGRR